MKTYIKILAVLFTSFIILSCSRDEVPEDIHEHEEIEKVVLTVIDKNDTLNEQIVNIIGGEATPNLNLQNGKTYLVSLDFQVKHDDHYHSANDEIIEEKDEHFVLFNFIGVDAKVIRGNNDVVRTDGKKLGLKTEWTIQGSPNNSKVHIILNHGASSVQDNYPSASNQLGSAVGGESDVDVSIKVQ